MQALMVRLHDWLKNEGIFSADDPALQRTLQNPCMAKFTAVAGEPGLRSRCPGLDQGNYRRRHTAVSEWTAIKDLRNGPDA